MANRFLFTDRGSLDKGLADLFCQFTAGTSGAVPTHASLTQSNGFGEPVLSGTGLYTFHLSDPWVALADYNVTVQQGTFDATHGYLANLVTNSITSGSDPLVSFQIRNLAGTAAALTSGDIIRVHLIVRKMASN
jgi:hypothetical protein